MSAKTARREYLQATAEFQRSIREFSAGMAKILDSPQPELAPPRKEPASLLAQLLGPQKPAKRAPRAGRGAGRKRQA
jgi:hypothetical protein